MCSINEIRNPEKGGFRRSEGIGPNVDGYGRQPHPQRHYEEPRDGDGEHAEELAKVIMQNVVPQFLVPLENGLSEPDDEAVEV